MNEHHVKVLLVANVAKEHVLKFHIPTIKRMRELGWQVDVACSGKEHIPYCNKQICTSWTRSPFSSGTIKGIKELKSIISEGQYDVIYCHTPVGGAISRIAGKKFRKDGLKIIYMSHGFHFYKGAPILNWLLYYPLEKLMANWTDCIITINEEDYNNAK